MASKCDGVIKQGAIATYNPGKESVPRSSLRGLCDAIIQAFTSCEVGSVKYTVALWVVRENEMGNQWLEVYLG
jgi:hypothetical protein